MSPDPRLGVMDNDNSFEQLPLDAKRRVDAVCARFEEAWREGRPSLQDFATEVPEEERSVLVEELLHIDIECRRRRAEVPRAEDYLQRLPGHEALIRAILPESLGQSSGEVSTLGEPGSVRTRSGPQPLQVPGYEVLEEIGRGGMGIVYKARHLALNRMVALKFILTSERTSPRDEARFRREAEVIARLRHPNIIQIYDIGEVNGQCFLALEYAEGGSLRERLAGMALEPRAAAMLLEPLARAVQHAHRVGVIHRDLKPANILLAPGGDSMAYAAAMVPFPASRPAGPELPNVPSLLPPLAACTPKLTDFGLAKVRASSPHPGARGQSATGAIIGTPGYMAPEQVGGSAEVGPAVDIWALGATLYELLTGRPPFRASTAAETLQKVLEANPIAPRELNPAIPRDLETLCLKCLEKQPENRYPGARELAQDLRRFLDGEAILARPTRRTRPLMRWAHRHPGKAFLAVVLAVGVLTTLAMALVSLLG